jgi:hypothetical protein
MDTATLLAIIVVLMLTFARGDWYGRRRRLFRAALPNPSRSAAR